MRESSRAALCGISAGLSIVIMMMTYLTPLLVYTAPPAAGLLIMTINEELGRKRSLGVFAAVSLLSVFIIADKEAAVFYTLFFGWYPAVKPLLDKKIRPRAARMAVKLALFSVSLASAAGICAYVLHIDYSDFGDGGKIMMWFFFGMFIVLMYLFDFFLDKMLLVYRIRVQKRLRKLFRR